MEVDRRADPGFAPGRRSFCFRRNLYEPHNELAETLGASSAYKSYRIR